MAELGFTINPSDHSTEQNDFELMPDMVALLEISASDLRHEGNNLSVSLTVDVIEPEQFKGRKFWLWIDYQNDDAERQRRGQEDISKVCRAIGHEGGLSNTEHLHFHAFTATVDSSPAGVGKASGKPYKAKNKIKRYWYPDENNAPAIGVIAKAANDNRPAAANDNRPAQAQAATANGKKNPWSK